LNRAGGWDQLIAEILREKARGTGAALPDVPKDRPRSLAGRIRRLKGRGILPVIGEIKPSSPSAGVLRNRVDAGQLVPEMEGADVAGISVLTEPRLFGGSKEMLVRVTSMAGVPVLMKDFLVDPMEVEEARRLGADAVLLIVRLLGKDLQPMFERAIDLGLTPLVEVHDEGELEEALDLDPEIIGINNRNLSDLTVDIENTARLSHRVPDGVLVVSESGYSSREEITRMEPHCDAFLVGSALMRGSPGDVIRELQGRSSG